METLEADVAIVGSGIAGALCGYMLARRGIRVVILEAGPRTAREAIGAAFRATHQIDSSAGYPNTDLAPRPEPNNPKDDLIIHDGPLPYKVEFLKLVGGTTWHWAGGATRFSPSDFRLHSAYGRGRDWPISYSELEPYYAQADRELGVSGKDGHNSASARSTPFPLPPSPSTAEVKGIVERLARHGIDFVPFSAARATRDYDGRPKCLGFNSCMAVCPTGALYNAIVHVEKSEAAGARIIDNALVTRLVADPNTNAISSLDVRRADGTSLSVVARSFVIAANGLETPRLLLMSASERLPRGIANSSDQVGRNLMDHPGYVATMQLDQPVNPGRGPSHLATCWQHSDTPARRSAAGFRLNIANIVDLHRIAVEVIEEGTRSAGIDQEIRRRATCRLSFDSALEALPAPNNCVRIDPGQLDRSGLPKMRIRFALGDYEEAGLAASRALIERISVVLGAHDLKFGDVFMHSHLMGTTIMGTDPRDSVVDGSCRTHDHPNLFVSSSAVYPSSGCGHPTLTIAALSIRIAETIAQDFGG